MDTGRPNPSNRTRRTPQVARSQTAASERAKQRKATASQVAAEVGRPTGIREADRHRRAQKQAPPPGSDSGYVVRDRAVEFDPADSRRIGQVLARVSDLKARQGYVALVLEASAEFGHCLFDASQVSRSAPLLVTLDELYPPAEEDSDDAS
jgi:hypothetical protein